MLLKIKRSQKSSMMGNALFALDFRAEFAREERELIDKYKLGKMIAYSVIAHPRLGRVQFAASTEPLARQVRIAAKALRPRSMPVSMTEQMAA